MLYSKQIMVLLKILSIFHELTSAIKQFAFSPFFTIISIRETLLSFRLVIF